MSKKKRYLSLFLALIMLVPSLSWSVIAVDANEISTDAVITVNNAAANPGEVVNVDIVIENNPGILGMTLSLNYDESIASLTGVKNGDALSVMTFTSPKELGSGCQLPWDAENVVPEDVKDGVIATLTFKVSETAEPGSIMDVVLSYKNGAIIDKDMTPLKISMVSGQVSVVDYTPGDLNEDGLVNTTDVVALRRYIAGGYGVNIKEPAADVNDDGILNTTDVVAIRRYIAGGYGIKLLLSTPKCDHANLTHTSAKEATASADGNIEYWTCLTCNKVFSDSAASYEIDIEDTVIKATYFEDSMETLVITNFDLNSVSLSSGYIHGGSGTFYSNTDYQSTDYIDISGFDGCVLSVTAYINGNSGFALYDKDKVYLNGANGNTSGFTSDSKAPQTVEWDIPEDACYVRFTLNKLDNISNYPMSAKIVNIAHTINSFVNNAISAGKSRNIDLSNVKVFDGYIAGNSGGFFESTVYRATDFISIVGTEGSVLTFKSLMIGNAGWAFYDKNEKFIYGMNGNTEGVTGDSKKGQIVTCVVPDGTCYVRFSMKSTENTSTYPMSVEYANLATFAESISKEVAEDITPRLTTFCLVNPAAKAYMDDVTYPDDDYSYSYMYSSVVPERNYGAKQLYKTDRPLPVFIELPKDKNITSMGILLSTSGNLPTGGKTSTIYQVPFGVERFPIYNLLPNTTYYYRVDAAYADGSQKTLLKDSFTTTADQLRMIYIEGVNNCRDLGGWKTYDAEGNQTGTVKYGRLYRGGALDEQYYFGARITFEGAHELVHNVGVRAELDLRGGYTKDSSPLSKDLLEESDYLSVPYQSCMSLFTDTGKSSTKSAFEFLLAKLNDDTVYAGWRSYGYKPVYYHCSGGADRTGTLSYLLLALLGVSESDVTKDYELTSFSEAGYRIRNGSEYGFPEFVAKLKTYNGDTLQAKVETFLLECGISADDIAAFKTAMIEPMN